MYQRSEQCELQRFANGGLKKSLNKSVGFFKNKNRYHVGVMVEFKIKLKA